MSYKDIERRHKLSIAEVLQLNDDDLCIEISYRISPDTNSLCLVGENDDEIVVTLVMSTIEYISNGGFEYFLNGFFEGDKDYSRTIQSFRIIGDNVSADILDEIRMRYPGRTFPNNENRIKIYLSIPKKQREKWNFAFWEQEEQTIKLLAKFIREHKESFFHLSPQK